MITTERNAGVLTLYFDRIDKKNAITLAMYQQLADAINEASSDASIKVILFSAKGEHFTAGNDLQDFLSNPDLEKSSAVYQFLQALIYCPLPIVAAVRGFAIGIGATLLLHCEQVFADSTASVAFPFINLGLVPEAASSLLLPRLVGYQQAAHLLLKGEPLSAEQALNAGIIAQLTVDEELDQKAMNYASELAQKPRTMLIEIKSLLRADKALLQECLDQELKLFKQCLKGPVAKEVMAAFIEKRSPNFDNL